MEFKVVTLNCWLAKRKQEFFDYLEYEQPDVLLLQEFPARPGQDLLGEVEAKLEMRGVFEPMWEIESWGELGLAIFSKWNFKRVEKEFYYKNKLVWPEFPKAGEWEFPGLFLGGELEMNMRNIWIATTHFVWSLYPEITDEQRQAGKNLLKTIAKHDQLILGGDFNVTHESEIYKMLVSQLKDDNPDNLRNTLQPEVHRSRGLDLAVDFMFHKGEMSKLEAKVPMVKASDHLPVVVTYQI